MAFSGSNNFCTQQAGQNVIQARREKDLRAIKMQPSAVSAKILPGALHNWTGLLQDAIKW